MADILLTSFNPIKIAPKNYLKMYQFTIELFIKKQTNNSLVALILHSFDLSQWLEAHKPRLCDVTALLAAAMSGIISKSENSENILKVTSLINLLNMILIFSLLSI